MTLTEFLLARITDDEGHALDFWGDDDTPGTWSAWFKAECEAKRRIVEAATKLDNNDASDFVVGGDMDYGIDYAITALGLALSHLASVYADHPDYREEWR